MSPSATRVACHSSSDTTIAVIIEQDAVGLVEVRAAEAVGPLHLPDRARRSTTPASTATANTSTSHANHVVSPISGRCPSGSTIAIAASTIVGSSTTNPQKIAACIRPGHEPLEELPLADDVAELAARALGGRPGAIGVVGAGRAKRRDTRSRPAPGERGRRRHDERASSAALSARSVGGPPR